MMLTTASLFRRASIVCVLYITKTTSFLHQHTFIARPRSPTSQLVPVLRTHHGWVSGPLFADPSSATLGVLRPAEGTLRGTKVDVICGEDDEIGTVIDRALAT
jgi:hypothetical protein